MIPLPSNESSRWKTEHINLDMLHKFPRHKLITESKQKLNKMVNNHRSHQNPISTF